MKLHRVGSYRGSKRTVSGKETIKALPDRKRLREIERGDRRLDRLVLRGLDDLPDLAGASHPWWRRIFFLMKELLIMSFMAVTCISF